jgi:TetR/AcrR family transcriptional regulator of autoinduction and epiphytic fitness
MRTKQQVVSEFRRKEIIDAARSVFARRGFTSGIMDQIAKDAGIAKGTIYLYFRSKTEIYRAVLDHDMEALKKETLARIDAADGLKEKIRSFILTRLENSEARREFFQIMDTETGHLSLTREQYRDWLAEPVLKLASAIDDALAQSEIRAVPSEKVAWMIADITRGTIQRRLLGKSESSPSEDADFLLDIFWTALQH